MAEKIRLDVTLHERGFVDSREKAKALEKESIARAKAKEKEKIAREKAAKLAKEQAKKANS